MNCDSRQLLLYAVTDRSWLGQSTLLEQVEEALRGGITMLQLREKELDKNTLKEEAIEVKLLCKQFAVPFIVNDYVDLMLNLDADGVHVGQEDMDAQDVRAQIGPDKILGVSVQTVQQAIKAQQAGADYLGVGAVFPTSTKANAADVNKETLRAICQAVKIPVVAIGGIGAENIPELKGSGIVGVAVVSAIFAQKEITKSTRNLKTICEEVFDS